MPFIQSVKTLDARIQTMDNQADRFVTKEKKDLIVDSYIKWRISDFSRYYLATGGGDVSQAEVLLKRKFSDRLRSEIGRLDVKDIVTDSRGRLTLEVRDALNSGSAGTEDEVSTPAADDAIAKAAERVQAETNGKVPVINPNSMAALGIEVVDVRIKQINLPAEVSEAIYNRMRAEREAVARRHRSQGQEEAESCALRRTMKSPRRWRNLSVRAVSCAVKVMPKRRSCLPMPSARIRTSMPLSVACVLTRIASRATRM
jgi:membrane protease subunit HflC